MPVRTARWKRPTSNRRGSFGAERMMKGWQATIRAKLRGPSSPRGSLGAEQVVTGSQVIHQKRSRLQRLVAVRTVLWPTSLPVFYPPIGRNNERQDYTEYIVYTI